MMDKDCGVSRYNNSISPEIQGRLLSSCHGLISKLSCQYVIVDILVYFVVVSTLSSASILLYDFYFQLNC